MAHALAPERPGLRRRLKGLRRAQKEGRAADPAIEAIERDLERSVSRRQARAATVPPVQFPDDLPVAQARAAIQEAIARHPVVVVSGETGSGKTTQLPKLCLAMGRGQRGQIA